MHIVIGAGLSGLHASIELRKRGHRVLLLERTNHLGGRVRSVYDEHGEMLYEAGPWRIPSKHHRMRALCREHGVQLTPIAASPPRQSSSAAIRGLSIWGSNALTCRSPVTADMLDLDTGYADETHAAAGTSPYVTDSPTYFVAPGGFSSLIERMQRTAQELGVDVRTDARVVDVVKAGKEYSVRVVARQDAKFVSTRHLAQVVVVCVPPHIARHWQILRDHAMPAMCAVTSGSLNHIYARDSSIPQSFHKKESNSLLAQMIGDLYGRGWFQVSYSGGRVARFWNNLWLSNPIRCIQALTSEIWTQLGRCRVLRDVRMHFWEHAYHTWVPTPGFDLDHVLRMTRQPHPLKLPGVYLAGEAFSEHQAWMEGALCTADRVIAAIEGAAQPVARRVDPSTEIVLDGRILDMSTWMHVHPGGAAAIKNHLRDKDVKDLWEHIHSTDRAWAIVLTLQRGWAAP